MKGMQKMLGMLPPATRGILVTTGLATLVFSVLIPIFNLLGWVSPWLFFGLSQTTFGHLWLWQLFTFGLPSAQVGSLGFGMLLSLGLELLFVAQVGSHLERRLGSWAVAAIWWGSLLVSGIASALVAMQWADGPLLLLLGSRPAIAAILTAWMIASGNDMVFLFVAPVRIKWIAGFFLAMDVLQLIGASLWLRLLASALGALFAYTLCTAVWDLTSPFDCMWRLDRLMHLLGRHLKRFGFAKTKRGNTPAVIIDFRTGREIHR